MGGSENDGTDKISRVIAKYGLDEIGSDMVQLWTGDGDERMSLRELADHFNKQLVQTAIQQAGGQVLDGETDNLYRLLLSEEETADRTRAIRRLERDGVDVEGVVDDFVSYQTVRRYLNTVHDAEYSRSQPQPKDTGETIQRLKSRTVRVTDSKLEGLSQRGEITLGDNVRTTVDVRVFCPDCRTGFEIQELLDNGGCNC